MGERFALATVDLNEILLRISNGAHLARIASEHSVSRQALRQNLSVLPGYREALEDGQEARLQAIIAKFAEANIPVPPLRPVKRPSETKEAYAERMDEHKSAMEAWRGSVTINEFEIAKWEKAWRSESWVAERTHPQIYGQKGTVHLTGGVTLDELLLQLERQREAKPAIDGESSAVPAI